MRTIKEALENFLKKFPYSKKMEITKLWIEWDKIMIEDWAEEIYPLGTKEDILVIGVKDNLAMQEVFFKKKDILRRIEEFLGFQPFKDIVIEFLGTKIPLNRIRINRI